MAGSRPYRAELGVCMEAKRKLGSQLNTLLTGMAVHGIAHLEEMENDLIQTNVLLEEAIAKLNGGFLSVHESLLAHLEVAGRMASGSGSEGESDLLGQLANEVAGHVNTVVTGLQFQDMTSQLIDRALKRVQGLRVMLELFGSVGPALMQQDACEGMVGLLKSTNENFAQQNRKLKRKLKKNVRQQHMEEGSVDLF